MKFIDLRSDTVSHPTPAMRQAMANAEVGDDVFGDDPTVNQLEHDAAQLFGREAGMFVPSGTQGNLIAMLVHCPRGTEIILGDKAHTFLFEAGGMSALGGIMAHTIPVQADGTLRLDDITKAIRGDNYHFPRTRLVTIENTQNAAGGVALSPEYTHQVTELAHRHGLAMHIDGARIFNAITAFNSTPQEMIGDADSLTFCLSKALCAPVGSVLVGSKSFIAEARRMRKLLGGGMRQVGVLAAAGLIALHEMPKRLHEDHTNAKLLAEGLLATEQIRIIANNTNFVFFELDESAKVSAAEFEKQLGERGIIVRMYPGTQRTFRAVMHYWINREAVDTVLSAVREILQ
jgi:threonine aldolase